MAAPNGSKKETNRTTWFRIWLAAMLLTVSVSIGNFILTEVWTIVSGDEAVHAMAWPLAVAMLLAAAAFIAPVAKVLADFNSRSNRSCVCCKGYYQNKG